MRGTKKILPPNFMKNHAKFAVGDVVYAVNVSGSDITCGKITTINYRINGSRHINKDSLSISYFVGGSTEEFFDGESKIYSHWDAAYKHARKLMIKDYNS
jgi:hypothetical protein